MAEGDLALVTGAAGGMGQATVERLSRDGFRIAGLDINEKGLAEAVKRAKGEARAYRCDQTDEAEVRETVKRIEAEMGPVDVLVNTIGWGGATRFEGETSDYWRKVIAINYEAVLYVTSAVLPGMIERRRGKIVNVASDAGRVGTSTEAVYSGCKAGVIAFSKSLARENARHNINVNVVSPGPTMTPLLEEEMRENPDVIQRMIRIIPFRRVATAEEQAAAIAFLCSPDSDYITGQTLSVSGGLTMV